MGTVLAHRGVSPALLVRLRDGARDGCITSSPSSHSLLPLPHFGTVSPRWSTQVLDRLARLVGKLKRDDIVLRAYGKVREITATLRDIVQAGKWGILPLSSILD